MNEYDSNRIYDLASIIGYSKTQKKIEADCYILNTCHIREKATEKVYHEIGRVKKDFRNLKKPLVVVSGCVTSVLESPKLLDISISFKLFKKEKSIFFSFSFCDLSSNEIIEPPSSICLFVICFCLKLESVG